MGPLAPGEFVADDFKTLASYEYRKRVGPVVEALEDILGPFEDEYGISTPMACMLLTTLFQCCIY